MNEAVAVLTAGLGNHSSTDLQCTLLAQLLAEKQRRREEESEFDMRFREMTRSGRWAMGSMVAEQDLRESLCAVGVGRHRPGVETGRLARHGFGALLRAALQ
jgi:hypothetical protein